MTKEMTIMTKVMVGVMIISIGGVGTWSVAQLYSVSEIKTEMRYMNKNMKELGDTAKEMNVQLKAYVKHHGQNLAIITKGIVVNTQRIESVEERCRENHESIRECERYHLRK